MGWLHIHYSSIAHESNFLLSSKIIESFLQSTLITMVLSWKVARQFLQIEVKEVSNHD